MSTVFMDTVVKANDFSATLFLVHVKYSHLKGKCRCFFPGIMFMVLSFTYPQRPWRTDTIS